MKRYGPGYYTVNVMPANDLATKETAAKLSIILSAILRQQQQKG